MKRTALVAGLIIAGAVFVPGTVGATDYETTDHSWHSAHTATWNPHELDCEYENQTGGTIVDELVANGNFTTLVAAVQAAGLAETLSAPGDLTVFAPTDDAFAQLPAGTVEALLADKAALTSVLTNHVAAGRIDGDTAVWAGEAQVLSGSTLHIGYGDDGVLYVNDSPVSVTDINTSNGIVHVVDAVILPKAE